LFIVLYLWTPNVLPFAAATARSISVADCIRTRRVYKGQVALSPDGTEIAYIVKAPNIGKDKNEFIVYVIATSPISVHRSNGELLYKSDAPLKGLRWVRNPARLVLLEDRANLSRVILLNPKAGRKTVVAASKKLSSFSVDAGGRIFVYAAEEATTAQRQRQQANKFGFPIIFGEGVEPTEPEFVPSTLFLVKRSNRQWVRSRLALRWIGEGTPETLFDIEALSLSPNGSLLTFNFHTRRIPKAWKTNPYMKLYEHVAAAPMTLGMADLKTRTFRLGFDTPSAGFGLPTVWAADSRAFSVVALCPTGSLCEENDRNAGFNDGMKLEYYTHLFSVDVKSLRADKVVQRPVNWYQNGTLFWKTASGRMLVQTKTDTYAWLVRENLEWHEQSESHNPFGPVELRSGVFLSQLNASSDGRKVIGVLENVRTPPDLFVHQLASGKARVLTDLNPEYRDRDVGEIERLEWTDDLGFKNTGYMIKPVGFTKGRFYPLVIMAKGWGNFFLADTHFQTAFPPQPLAARGFLVLMANVLPLDQGPSGYAGKMGEAYQFIAMVKSAVRSLSQQGVIDPLKVGLIGFSRTSWETDFMITHSDFRFAAVSSADSGIYNYESYWILNSRHLMSDYEGMLGGPPYGETLANTLRFAPAFNAQRVNTPVLMEYTKFPGDLTANLEFFVALKRQHKTVEMFSYPNGEHDLDVPTQRLASLQRNVDWFRFWLQGVEGTAPSYDPDQFVRWNKLKKDTFATPP
jgi:hypothetical protein